MSPLRLWIDTETRSRLKLTPGVYKYRTQGEVILVQWALNDDPVDVWEANGTPPAALIEALLLADERWAAGEMFDRTMLETCEWYRKLNIPISAWRCLQGKARAHGLPGGGDKLCQIFNIPIDEAKDARGKALIQIFCKPNKSGGYNDKLSHPTEWAEFVEYARQDIVWMRAVFKKIPSWNDTPFELGLRTLDATMNARGVGADLALCRSAIDITTAAKLRLAEETSDITLGAVDRTTQRNKLLQHIMDAYDVKLPDLTADTVERRLEDPELPEPVKMLLINRQEASKSSTAKYKRVLDCEVDGSLYGLLVYCGASRTGRWAGRTFQPHNMMRPTLKQWQIDASIDWFKANDIEALDLIGTPHMEVAANLMRSVLIARPGHKIVAADLANIEGRDLTWMAGEEWKLQAFRDADAGVGPDLYKVSYGRAMGVDPEDIAHDSLERQIGKVIELALQYYGGVGAFISMSEVYSLDLDAMAATAWPSLSRHAIARATEDWFKAVKKRRTFGLAQRTWTVCQCFVLAWRSAHPGIMGFHKDIETAVIDAIHAPNRPFHVRGFVVDRLANWLRIKCPSGSYLCYPSPRYDDEKRQLSYLGVNPYTRQWQRIKTYSGKISQNLTERVARDTLAAGIIDAEAAGYRPLLTVHDEAITEPPDDPKYNVAALVKILTKHRAWSAGLPLAAKGFEGPRYKKD